MIPAAAITAWGQRRPWPTVDAIEQDLLLARTIVAIYDHPLLREDLVFRGGTALHQLHLPEPLRYSEDLDFVRRSNTAIGPVLDALREVARTCGLEVAGTVIGEHPKIKFRAQDAVRRPAAPEGRDEHARDVAGAATATPAAEGAL